MSSVSVSKTIKVLEDKRKTLQWSYRNLNQEVLPEDKTKIRAWELISKRLRGLKQKTISRRRLAQITQEVVHKEMHLIKSPFQGIFEYGDTAKVLGLKRGRNNVV